MLNFHYPFSIFRIAWKSFEKKEPRVSQIHSMEPLVWVKYILLPSIAATPPTNLTKHFCELIYANTNTKKTDEESQQASSHMRAKSQLF